MNKENVEKEENQCPSLQERILCRVTRIANTADEPVWRRATRVVEKGLWIGLAVTSIWSIFSGSPWVVVALATAWATVATANILIDTLN